MEKHKAVKNLVKGYTDKIQKVYILKTIQEKQLFEEEMVKVSTNSSYSEGKYVAYAVAQGLIKGETNISKLEMEASEYITNVRIKRIQGK